MQKQSSFKHLVRSTLLSTNGVLKHTTQSLRLFHTTSSKFAISTGEPTPSEFVNLKKDAKSFEEELRDKLSKFAEKDVDKLEKMLEQIVNQEGNNEDSRPYMIANVILLALFIVSILLRQRDEMMHDMTKELLVGTKEELGHEILRLRESRQAIIDQLLSSADCNEKCQSLVERLKQVEMDKDQQNANAILSGIKPVAAQSENSDKVRMV